MFKYYLLTFIVLLTVTACGQSGPLYLPHSSQHKEASAHVDH